MNNFYLIGKLIAEAERSQSTNGYDVVKLKVESRPNKDSDNTEIYELVGFKNIAAQDYPVGSIICASGRLQANNFSKDGTTFYRANLIISSISIIA